MHVAPKRCILQQWEYRGQTLYFRHNPGCATVVCPCTNVTFLCCFRCARIANRMKRSLAAIAFLLLAASLGTVESLFVMVEFSTKPQFFPDRALAAKSLLVDGYGSRLRLAALGDERLKIKLLLAIDDGGGSVSVGCGQTRMGCCSGALRSGDLSYCRSRSTTPGTPATSVASLQAMAVSIGHPNLVLGITWETNRSVPRTAHKVLPCRALARLCLKWGYDSTRPIFWNLCRPIGHGVAGP